MNDDRVIGLQDRDAREAFVRASYVGLYRWFCRLVGSADLAADLTQETFVAFWESVDRIRERASPRTWLYAIGRNLWHNHLRARRRISPEGMDSLAGDGPSVEHRLEDLEFREAAERAVGALPADLREVFVLRFWEEFGYEEIGTIQGVSASLARWRFFSARRRLHETLSAWAPDRGPAEEENHARRPRVG
jgi:RNA polymerase sigma-70 factor (ECF subfamily)